MNLCLCHDFNKFYINVVCQGNEINDLFLCSFDILRLLSITGSKCVFKLELYYYTIICLL